MELANLVVVGVAPAEEHGDAAANDVEPRPLLLYLAGQPLLHDDRGAASAAATGVGGGVAPAEHRAGGVAHRRVRRRLDPLQARRCRERPTPSNTPPAPKPGGGGAAAHQLLLTLLHRSPCAVHPPHCTCGGDKLY
jgi:hypothetical protein